MIWYFTGKVMKSYLISTNKLLFYGVRPERAPLEAQISSLPRLFSEELAKRVVCCPFPSGTGAPTRPEKSRIRQRLQSITCSGTILFFILTLKIKAKTLLNSSTNYGSPYFAGQEPNWMFNLYRVEFASSEPANYVDVTFVPSEGPIRFHRDLLFSDAPDPGFDVC